MHTPSHLLYLHGFRSSPRSVKALQTAATLRAINARRAAAGRVPVQWVCPQLPPSPAQAMREVVQAVRQVPRESLAIVGSSLGGFYATWLAHELDCRAVLLNPAVNPARDLRRHIGELTAWHDPQSHFCFTERHVTELRALELGDLSRPVPEPWRFLAVIARNDEILDWREMMARYAGSTLRVTDNGEHALIDYADRHLAAVLAFLDIAD